MKLLQLIIAAAYVVRFWFVPALFLAIAVRDAVRILGGK